MLFKDDLNHLRWLVKTQNISKFKSPLGWKDMCSSLLSFIMNHVLFLWKIIRLKIIYIWMDFYSSDERVTDIR